MNIGEGGDCLARMDKGGQGEPGAGRQVGGGLGAILEDIC